MIMSCVKRKVSPVLGSAPRHRDVRGKGKGLWLDAYFIVALQEVQLSASSPEEANPPCPLCREPGRLQSRSECCTENPLARA